MGRCIAIVFAAAEYRTPFLKQAIAGGMPDPLSRGSKFWQREAKLDAVRSLDFLTSMVSHSASESIGERGEDLAKLADYIDRAFGKSEVSANELPDERTIDDRLDETLQAVASSFAKSVPKKVVEKNAANESLGCLVVNPSSFVRRMTVDVSQLDALPNVKKPVYAAESVDSRKIAIVDVPAMGFAWVTAAGGNAGKAADRNPLLAEGNTLRNEFMQAVIDPESGGLVSLHDYTTRGNRLSHKLGMLLPKPEQKRASQIQ